VVVPARDGVIVALAWNIFGTPARNVLALLLNAVVMTAVRALLRPVTEQAMTEDRKPGGPARDPAEGAAENVNVPPTPDERGGRHQTGSPGAKAVRHRAGEASPSDDSDPGRRDRSTGGK
jgi:hypothetical protein